MKMFAFLNPFFHALSDGKLIRLTVAWVLRILAVLMALIGLFWFIAFVVFGFKSSEGSLGTHAAGVIIGCLLFALFGLAWGYLSAGILTFRANSVEELGDSHFTVLSILSLLLRLNGEMMFVTYSLIGVGGCLFVWFTDFSPFSQLGMLGEGLPFAGHTGTGFLGGIELAVIFLLLAFAGIIFFYALAELSVVLVEIALNTRGLRNGPGSAEPSSVPASPATVPVPQPSPKKVELPFVPSQRKCKKCDQPLDAGDTFCDECGTPVN
jgi:hypothetical protein